MFGADVGLLPIWSGRFRVVGSWSDFVRICSGLFGSVRGGRGWCRVVPYLVGVILRGRVLVGVVRICSGLFGSVRGVRGRALVGPLCCCGGATVSRCGASEAARGRFPLGGGNDGKEEGGMTDPGARV